MSENSQLSYEDFRKSLRVNENRKVLWKTQDGQHNGIGRIRNISASGMLMETNSDFIPFNQCVFSFDSELGYENFIPETGRLVWHVRNEKSKNKYLCGVKFVEPAEFVLTNLQRRIQKSLLKIRGKRFAKTVTVGFLFASLIGLITFVLIMGGYIYNDINKTNEQMFAISDQQSLLTQSYAYRYQASQLRLISVTNELNAMKQLYFESEGLLKNIKDELTSTKGILTQTEILLEQARVEQVAINGASNIGAAESSPQQVELENVIVLLEEKNLQLSDEVSRLKDQAKSITGEVNDVDDAKVLLQGYQVEMSALKEKIKYFQSEAQDVRKAALDEKSRLEDLTSSSVTESVAPQTPKVSVDVQFVE